MEHAFRNICGKLPYDSRIEYVESNGDCYIDTGFTDFASLFERGKIEVTSMVTRLSNAQICGSYRSWYEGCSIRYSNSGNGGISFDMKITKSGGTDADGIRIANRNEKTTYVVDNFGLRIGEASFPLMETRSTFMPSAPLTVLAGNQNGTVNSFMTGRLYSFKITIGDEPVMSLIPVLNDGAGCMYDAVSKKFFMNQGAGELIPGPKAVGDDL